MKGLGLTIALLVLAGCGSSGSTGGTPPSHSPVVATPSPTPSPPPTAAEVQAKLAVAGDLPGGALSRPGGSDPTLSACNEFSAPPLPPISGRAAIEVGQPVSTTNSADVVESVVILPDPASASAYAGSLMTAAHACKPQSQYSQLGKTYFVAVTVADVTIGGATATRSAEVTTASPPLRVGKVTDYIYYVAHGHLVAEFDVNFQSTGVGPPFDAQADQLVATLTARLPT